MCITKILVVVSVVLFALAVFWYFRYKTRRMISFGVLFFSVILLRFSVDVRGTENGLQFLERFFNSVAHAIQSFGLAEDYTPYIKEGKSILGGKWADFYGIYIAFLNVLCPIVGGTFLLTALTNLFPHLRLRLRSLNIFREIYYFSELNERSITFAKSLRKAKKLWKPIIVFTDVYYDNRNERSTEFANMARSLGFICMKTDISHIGFRRFGKKNVVLIDALEKINLQKFALFTEKKYYKHFTKEDKIYIFCESEAYKLVEEKIRSQLTEFPEVVQTGGAQEKPKGKYFGPVIRPINEYRNITFNLLAKHPLYKGLDPKGSEPLNVTIIGSGSIGTQFFLQTYWCGQLLNHDLHINIISKESRTKFVERMDYITREIFESSKKGSEMLEIYPDGSECAVPYFTFRYIETDICLQTFDRLQDVDEHEFDITKSNYILVALGNDIDNLEVARNLEKYVKTSNLSRDNGKTVITYAIYDDYLNNTLNQERNGCGQDRKIEMHAVASLEEIYSYDNFFMHNELNEEVRKTNFVYRNGKERKEPTELYEFWSTIARWMHDFYKAFSVGERRYADYEEKILNGGYDTKILDQLSWLEHRRWNAFMRINGYRRAKDEELGAYMGIYNYHNCIELKLHPCLVECDQKGIKSEGARMDWLDLLSNRLKKNFKDSDYPQFLCKDGKNVVSDSLKRLFAENADEENADKN